MNENQPKRQKYYNRRSQLKEKMFNIGDSVLWLKNNVWEVGVIVGKANTIRSYIVQDVKGKRFRRTSLHLKINKTNEILKQKEMVRRGKVNSDKKKTISGRLINKPKKIFK